MVAYCGDLGYPAARGAEMLSLMLGFGIVSRLLSGWIADRIGGLRTLLLGAVLQAVALALFLPFQGLASLYVISALFGLFQGGLVPSYPMIVRQYFSPREAGKPVHPQGHHQHGADAADDDGRHGAQPFGHGARPELSQLIGSAGAKRVDRAHPAAHIVRGFELHEG